MSKVLVEFENAFRKILDESLKNGDLYFAMNGNKVDMVINAPSGEQFVLRDGELRMSKGSKKKGKK